MTRFQVESVPLCILYSGVRICFDSKLNWMVGIWADTIRKFMRPGHIATLWPAWLLSAVYAICFDLGFANYVEYARRIGSKHRSLSLNCANNLLKNEFDESWLLLLIFRLVFALCIEKSAAARRHCRPHTTMI